jgi:hypothetical protein
MLDGQTMCISASVLQDVHPAAELTICMDISSNPGLVNITETSLDMNCTTTHPHRSGYDCHRH